MNSNRRSIAVGATLAALGTFAAASPSLAAHSATYVVKAQNLTFKPAHLTIRSGDRVTWEFLDAKVRAPHTVTSEGRQRFKDSPTPRLAGTFKVTFTKTGTYKFHCTVHPLTMNGVITVR